MLAQITRLFRRSIRRHHRNLAPSLFAMSCSPGDVIVTGIANSLEGALKSKLRVRESHARNLELCSFPLVRPKMELSTGKTSQSCFDKRAPMKQRGHLRVK